MTMTKAPGFTQLFPLPYGPLRALRSDPLGSQRQILAQYGEIVRVRIGPVLGHFLFHPDQVREVLHDRQKNYLRGWQYALMRRLFGDNLVVSEGDYWARQRRLAQPAFHRQRLAGYAEVMIDETAGLVTRWQRMADAGQAIDATPEMARLALAVAGRTLFSRDVSQEADSVGRAFGIVGPYLEYRFNRPFTSLPAWVPTSRNRRFQSAARTLNELVMEYIVERRREEGDRGDLLSMLMQIRDEDTGESMTDEQVRSEALTFLIAGHETTATALAWTWFYLGTHPAAQDRVREEVETVLGGRRPTLADVPQLVRTRMVIEESLRLAPPIWATPRQAVAEDELGGYRIPAGSTVLLSPLVTHRHPDFWEEPDAFKPERFSPEHSARRPKGAYFPFLAGPHQCIGQEFAMMEMRLVVAMILQAFEVSLVPEQAIRPLPSITLRPDRPVMINLKPLGSRASVEYVTRSIP